MINKTILIGRVTQAPKKYLTGNEPFISYTFLNIAMTKKVKNQKGEYQESTEFVTTSFFRNQADFITNYVNTGDLVLIEGHIKTRKKYNEYTRKNDYSIEIIGDNIKILTKSKKQEQEPKTVAPKSEPKQMGFKESIKTDELEFTEDDLPF